MIPPFLWNACDFVLQFHFKNTHVLGRMNTAADFLSHLDISPKEKVLLQIREDIQTTPIQVNIQSSDKHEKDQFYFLPEDDSETEEHFSERKSTFPKNNKLILKPIQTKRTSERRTCHWSATTSKTRTRTKAPATSRQKFSTQPETTPRPEPRPQKPQTQNIEGAIWHPTSKWWPQSSKIFSPRGPNHHQRRTLAQTIFWRYWKSEIQVLLPHQLIDEFIQHHHGKYGKQPGIAKTIQQCREKYYFPGLAARIANHISQYMECARPKGHSTVPSHHRWLKSQK